MLKNTLYRFARCALVKTRNRKYYTVKSEIATGLKDNQLPKQLYMQIKTAGPITVAEYMKQVLIHPLGGYYIHKDAFGAEGDFVTSPELSQMFGEMIAIWFLNEWKKIGSPKPFNIVELGPGRGSLMQDLLRVFDHFGALKASSVHLVEVSELLADLQARRLCMNVQKVTDSSVDHYKEGISSSGVQVRWYRDFKQLPPGFTFLVAHEFFDALPVHKFVQTPDGHREMLIDIQPDCEEHRFRYVRAREPTPVGQLFLSPADKRSDIEVSPDSLVLSADISHRLEEHGGFALIADYGHNGEGTDTFRAFKKHKQHDPLIDPGTADLTADVDFGMLKKSIEKQGGTVVYGPVTQRQFLLSMGMQQRLDKLKELVDEEQKTQLEKTFQLLTGEREMGTRFKFLALAPAVLKDFLVKFPPVGFTSST